VVGSRSTDLGRASVIGVEPSSDGGTSGSVAENPCGNEVFLGEGCRCALHTNDFLK
jgi:hypothetical protein